MFSFGFCLETALDDGESWMGAPGNFSGVSAPFGFFLDMYESDTFWKSKLLDAAVLGSAVTTATLQSFRHVYNCISGVIVSLSSSGVMFLLNYLVFSELIGSVVDL